GVRVPARFDAGLFLVGRPAAADDVADRRRPRRDPARGRLAGAVAARHDPHLHVGRRAGLLLVQIPQATFLIGGCKPWERGRPARMCMRAGRPRSQGRHTAIDYGMTCPLTWNSISPSSSRSVTTRSLRFSSPGLSPFSLTVRTWTGLLSLVLSCTVRSSS